MRAQPLYASGRLAGLLIIELPRGSDRHKQAESMLDLAARIIQRDLILNSELEVAQADHAYLSDLMSRAGSIAITSTVGSLG